MSGAQVMQRGGEEENKFSYHVINTMGEKGLGKYLLYCNLKDYILFTLYFK